MFTFSDCEFSGKCVLVREDFNVPIKNGIIQDETRLLAACPTIETLMKAGAKIILVSHLGRPTPGEYDAALSLEPVAIRLSELLQKSVRFVKNWDDLTMLPGEIVLLENIRFEKGETDNDPVLAKRLAALCDIFVMDAFAVSHRAAASTVGVIEEASQAVVGPLLKRELEALHSAFTHPEHPLVAVVGGSKVSTKLSVLKALLTKVDTLIVGGGIANTFLLAAGQSVGESLVEAPLVDTARDMLKFARENGKTILLPIDVIVADNIDAATGTYKTLKEITADDKIFDVGTRASEAMTRVLKSAKTIIWNGPVGVFENPAFASGTAALAKAIANSHAFSLAGGGDTLSAISQFQIGEAVSYISTGGGAFLEWLAGDTLPAVAALEQKHFDGLRT